MFPAPPPGGGLRQALQDTQHTHAHTGTRTPQAASAQGISVTSYLVQGPCQSAPQLIPESPYDQAASPSTKQATGCEGLGRTPEGALPQEVCVLSSKYVGGQLSSPKSVAGSSGDFW